MTSKLEFSQCGLDMTCDDHAGLLHHRLEFSSFLYRLSSHPLVFAVKNLRVSVVSFLRGFMLNFPHGNSFLFN